MTSMAAKVKLLFYNGSLFFFALQVLLLPTLAGIFLFSLNCNNMIENSNDGWPLLQGEQPTNNARKNLKKKKENPSPFTGLSRKSKLCCIILSFFQ